MIIATTITTIAAIITATVVDNDRDRKVADGGKCETVSKYVLWLCFSGGRAPIHNNVSTLHFLRSLYDASRTIPVVLS